MNPLGPMSSALETARQQLAACPSYQAFLGVGTSADAIKGTYLAALPPPADGNEYSLAEWLALRPFAMIFMAQQGGYGLSRSALYAWRENGRLMMVFEVNVPKAYQPDPDVPPIDLTVDLESADRWILNLLGQIVSEFVALGGQPGYLDVSSVTVQMGPCRERHEESITNEFYYWTIFEIGWGATE